jgi:predicted amidohydrolase
MKTFTAAGIQMDIAVKDAEKNLDRALYFIDEAARKNANMICLPELFITGFDYDYIEKISETFAEKVPSILGEKAKEAEAYIIAGSIPERRRDGIYNTSIFFNPRGEVIGKYSKIHLFPLMKEEKYFTAGRDIPVFSTEFGRVGIMICYDLRFPELARKLTLKGAEVIFLPSQFPYPRLDHWRILLQARAIENQIYIVAVNRVGSYGTDTFFGRTSIIDPWGETISSSGDEERIVTAEIMKKQGSV